ncbi:MAG: undecaprenyldiphospho-muramoylpentapeptide beta-N-acetylglucosaminyltransferase [Chlamydiae bacterium]|nr:undecaprenyldiphospho-muramoylpentapeptide beta-N-acetylglucosaminyltransferase [Chlamydiota bacterium]MBI3276746.1 undecaprenyldiphospho-muramoylpentapeptide beta-N-acetylglucosaminyltransferase [Chlamydiota bacterium]
MRVAICTGKTGGHVFPALAVARELKSKNTANECYFIGTRNGLDQSLLQKEEIHFEGILGEGVPSKLNWKMFKAVTSFLLALIEVKSIFKRLRPDVVLSFGGFISCAPVLMAHWMKIPVVIHEANVHPGRANRFLSRWAKVICTGFSAGGDSFPSFVQAQKGDRNIRITGIPLRKEFFKVNRQESFQDLKLDPLKWTLFVMGGSLGARSVNEYFLKCLPLLGELSKKIQIIHVTGKNDYQRMLASHPPNDISYQMIPFLERPEKAFACADLFIGRAGASTLGELASCGLSSILIPYPHAAENHQVANASYWACKGAAHMIEEKECSPDILAQEISQALLNEPLRKSLSMNAKKMCVLDADSRVVSVLEEVVK